MYRITTQILNARNVLHHYNPSFILTSSIKRTTPCLKYKKATERETCPPPPTPLPPPPMDDRIIWGTLTAIILAGGFAVYAKTSPEIRDWLTIRAPWFDDFIAVLYQENMTYKEFAEQSVSSAKKSIDEYFKEKPKQCSSDGTPVPVKPVKVVAPKETSEGDGLSPCDKLPPPKFSNVCDVEMCLKDIGDIAINNYLTARDACSYYNRLVGEIMVKFKPSSIKELQAAKEEREKLVKTSQEEIDIAVATLDELTRYLECMEEPKDKIDHTKAMFRDYRNKIKRLQNQFKREQEFASVRDRQWDLVATLITKYKEENETVFSGLKYDDDKLKFFGDADLLLYHTYKYTQMLQQELTESLAGMTERVERGLEALDQNEKLKKARDNKIEAEIKRRTVELDAELQQRSEAQRLKNENNLKDALKQQLDRHEQQLAIKLEEKQKEATIKLHKLVSDKVADERDAFKRQLTDMANKVKLVEDKVNSALKAESESRRSQELYIASSSLLAKTKGGEPLMNVEKEIMALERASSIPGPPVDNDKLVATVLKSIPDSVRKEGVVPESILRKKYRVVEKTALRVALVEQEGAPLHVYILSYIQSLFLFMKLNTIPQAELDSPPKEPLRDFDTFDLLQRARYYLERGNLAETLRYVEALEGASRAACAAWREAARAHLETRQAAEAVLAHAAAIALQYL